MLHRVLLGRPFSRGAGAVKQVTPSLLLSQSGRDAAAAAVGWRVQQGVGSRWYSTDAFPEDPHVLKTLPVTKYVNLTINGKQAKVPEGMSIIEACKEQGVYVPTLCYHPLLRVVGTCRICLVSVDGKERLEPSCATKVRDGMNVLTHTKEVQENVRQVLEFLRCRHPNACMTCEVDGHCEFQNLVYRYQVEEFLPNMHHDRSHVRDTSSNSLVRDMNKCVLCSRCIRACSDVQGMNVYGMVGRGESEIVSTFNDVPMNQTGCISCGQCTAVCPVGALVEKTHLHFVDEGLQNKNGKIYVCQTAPAVRVAISEEFGLEPGTVSTGKMVSALKKLGFDYVFDTNFAADLTIMEEGAELVRRLNANRQLPMFTSCCPGWINLVEKHYPKLLPHLSTCKSPQGMTSSLIKTYFAQKLGLNPLDVVVVSVMPCVAKKDEIKRPQLTNSFPNEKGEMVKVPETDYVLTTREVAHLMERNRVHYGSLPDSEFDAPLGVTTGAAALFGTTGGVMEAALRSAYWMVTGNDLQDVEINAVRGMEGVREAVVDVAGIKLKCAIIHGTKNIRPIIEDILAGGRKYDFIEFMACPGGCIGGGGEPKNYDLDKNVLQKRQKAIFEIDKSKSLRLSHRNPTVTQLYDEFLGGVNSATSKQLLHTYYHDRSKEVKVPNLVPFGKEVKSYANN